MRPQISGRFAGKVAFVTGGASGIGEACARRLVAEGARVAIADADLPRAESLAGEIGNALALGLDVTDASAMARAVANCTEILGPPRLLIASAGITGNGYALGEMPEAEWRKVIAVNLDGVFNALNACFPAMAGGGAAVLVSSVMGEVGAPRFSHYTASKHALLGLVRAAALEGAAQGIRVNSVGPGFIDTPMQANRLDPARRAELAARHPLGRLGLAEEVAALILWLLCDEASFVTGSHHPVDGGYTAL